MIGGARQRSRVDVRYSPRDVPVDAEAEPVLLSVIIPTYNRATMLHACLESLCHQTASPSTFEVIVVVDGSSDGTREMLARLVTPFSLRIRWQKNSGPGAARNCGIEAAVGSYCLFLDDDITADPRLVAAHLRTQRERNGVIGLGQITCKLRRRANGFARYYARWWSDHFSRLNQGQRAVSFADCFSGNLSVPRWALDQVRGFALDLPRNDDCELGYRLTEHGLAAVYIHDAIGRQDYRKDFRAIVKDAENEGTSEVELYRRHPATLPRTRLGSFHNTSVRAVLLRRALLALHVPVRPLASAAFLMRNSHVVYQWYGFLNDYCYWRGVRRAVPNRDVWRRLTGGTPVLMYHAIGRPGALPSRYVLPADRFARQMAWLKWRRYRVLALEDFLRYQREYRLPPARSLVITFDDGYADNRSHAYPILRRYGYPATIFLVSGSMGKVNGWDRDAELSGRPILDWSAVKEMMAGDISYGAHSRTHPSLTAVAAIQAREEIVGSRADIEGQLGHTVAAFAYPYGKYDATIESMVKEANFMGACSVHQGPNDPSASPWALRRIEIYGTASLADFILTLFSGSTPRRFWRRPKFEHSGD